jgi:hypothetical protein
MKQGLLLSRYVQDTVCLVTAQVPLVYSRHANERHRLLFSRHVQVLLGPTSCLTVHNVQCSLCERESCREYYTSFAIFRPQNNVTLSIYERLSLGTCSTFKCGPTILIMSRVSPIIKSGGQCCQL